MSRYRYKIEIVTTGTGEQVELLVCLSFKKAETFWNTWCIKNIVNGIPITKETLIACESNEDYRIIFERRHIDSPIV